MSEPTGARICDQCGKYECFCEHTTLSKVASDAYFGCETKSGPIATEYWDRCAQAVADHVRKEFESEKAELNRQITVLRATIDEQGKQINQLYLDQFSPGDIAFVETDDGIVGAIVTEINCSNVRIPPLLLPRSIHNGKLMTAAQAEAWLKEKGKQ